MKPTITLTPKEIERCERYGRDVVASYARGENPNSRAVSGNRGAESDPVKQARARMAEWALCKFLGVYPGDLNWTMKPDPGYDVLFAKRRIDVKMTRHPNGEFLVWPLEIRHIFHDKKFDVLFFVRGIPPTFTLGGFVSKQEFWDRKLVAPADHKLEEGTWHMPESWLGHPETFRGTDAERAGHPNGFVGYDAEDRFVHYCQCGRDAGHGFGVRLAKGELGTWYCAEHKPVHTTA